jgi:acetyltransferase-like isoleucine patch superfamily enzyme
LSGKPGIGFSNKIVKTPKLIIGDKTFIGHGTSFAIADKIEIGKNCLIAGNVSIMDNDGHPLDYIKRRNNLPPDRESVKPVIIGNDVWIGRGAVIAKGVVIEDRAIIGAHAVVTKRVIADTVVAGNPAAVVKSIKAL